MASLIPKGGVIFNFADQAPAPSKDYCQILVDKKHITFRQWKVKRKGPNIFPKQIKDSYADFIHDERAQSELTQAFGKNMLAYIIGLAEGHIDYLPRIARPVLMRVLHYLDLEDITRLSLTSKFFWELCHDDDVWKQFYHDHSATPITEELSSLAEAIGWRKLFFTNKLQLQVQLSRRSGTRFRQAWSEDDSD